MATVPPAPTAPLLSSVTMTTMDASWASNGDGGSPITQYRVGYTTNPHAVAPTSIFYADSPFTLLFLKPATTYYVQAGARNALGWGPWSKAGAATTVAGLYIKVGTQWKLAIPYVRSGGIWRIAEPWVRNVGEWKRTT